MSSFADREILVGVTGGIAAYKTASLVSYLVQQSASVTVIMTESAQKFIGPATFAALTGRPVYDKVFASDKTPLGAHIELARNAELLCVAPASANFLGKIANGISDDLLTTLYLCFTGQVIVAPAMNCEMWDKAAVQRNIAQLKDDGVAFVEPGEGWLSCRQKGKGRMAEPDQIATSIGELLSKS